MSRKQTRRVVDLGLGAGYFALIAALLVVAMMAYAKAFTPSVEVELETGALGNSLQSGSDVKVNGVPVGRVSGVEPTGTGARLTLALDPDQAAAIPADSQARLLPKTLFGERYVVLQPGDSPTPLREGDTVLQDSSDEAVELEQLFDELLPMLQAIQPAKLTASLGEMATLLRGQGSEIGESMAAWNDYLGKFNPLVPTMTEDLAQLAVVAEQYEEALPDLLDALDTMTVTSQTLASEQTKLRDVFAQVTTGANTSHGWLDKNQDTIEILAEESKAGLAAVRPYAKQFPCLFEAVADFVPVMDKTLGKGTDEPGIHVRLNVVKSRGKYVPGTDAPSYTKKGKPRCPYVTGQSRKAADPDRPDAIAAPPTDLVRQHAAAMGLGEANSPGENQLIAELVAPTQGIAPGLYPDWGSLLVGPTLRNTKVTLGAEESGR